MTKFKASSWLMLCFLLLGCDVNDLGQQVEVRLEPDVYYDQWTQQMKDRDYIVITSLADKPVDVEKIVINRGGCSSLGRANGKRLMRYGSFIKVQLSNCNILTVKEVKLRLQGNDYVYNF